MTDFSVCDSWVELWLVNKIFYTVWGKIQPLKTKMALLDFESFLKIPRIVGKSSHIPQQYLPRAQILPNAI